MSNSCIKNTSNTVETINACISICNVLLDFYKQTPEEKEKYIERAKEFLWLYTTSTDSERKAITNESKKINDAIAVKKYREIMGMDTPDNEMVIVDPDKLGE
jgi:hypothetical protein